jgi:hypothetical protein
MRYRGFGLLECKVLCENRALADLGVRSDVWLPFMLDLEMVQAIKLAVDNEHEESVQFSCAQILFKGTQECMVVDVKYLEMKRLWVSFKAGTLDNNEGCLESLDREGTRRPEASEGDG